MSNVNDFRIKNGVLEKYNGYDRKVVIPDEVKVIGENAFRSFGWGEHSDIESVTIPDGVKIIEDAAFCGCSRLRNITIPDSVTSIGKMAFEDCSNHT